MSGRKTALTVRACPFCGGAPMASRLEHPVPRSKRAGDVVIGCGNAATCNVTLFTRGSSFGSTVMQWNQRSHGEVMANAYTLRPPALDEPTMGVLAE